MSRGQRFLGGVYRSAGWALALVVLLPVLAACLGDDGDEPTATEVVAATTLTATEAEPDATPTEADAPTATEEPVEPTATATDAPAAPTATPTETPVEPTSTVPSEPVVPGERPIDVQMNWLLESVNGPLPSDDEIEPHLHPSFIEVIPPADFAALIVQLQLSGPWEFNGYLGDPVELDGSALISGQGLQLQVLVGLEVAEPHRFMTLLFVPLSPPVVDFAGFDEIDDWLDGRAPFVSFQAAEITDGTCQPLHGVNPDQSLAVASAFKLWVLLELAERVAAGDLSWDDSLALSEELVSLPSGTLQVEPPGQEIPLRTYAAKMIALSDNTATDHLIDLLGRENVEARFGLTGHASPEQNMPLLLTRELFYLKLIASEEELAAYVAADSAGRRTILDGLEIDVSQADPNRLGTPTAIDSVEWFASASDFCGLLADLHSVGESDPVVRDILSASSGAPFDPVVWPFVGYKGGTEAGVVSGVWLLERADRRLFAVSIIMNNPEAGLDPAQLATLASGVADLLADLE